MNELSNQTSPYLLQHAQNPVHWKAWSNPTLNSARQQNKLIIISVGYSACHWCHVMEHESFEDEEVARTMNSGFISIKVDREERPDVDAVYMKAVQLMTKHGGWPMNVVALPDGRPVWGGTYFRKDEWIGSLSQLQKLYQANPEKMIEYAEKLHAGITGISLIQNKQAAKNLNLELVVPLVEKWKKSFDPEYGGMARAPKFMMPNNWQFLMHYAHMSNDSKLMAQVDLTLVKMAYGGLFDTVGGGFSRYSVDMKWHVPHFEKMLYDNGQLVSLYADAYKRTKNPLYKNVLEKTLEFVETELKTSEGAFLSAMDADSTDSSGHLEEGAFYVWTKGELETLLDDDFTIFSAVFNINDFGHWENGNYVLFQSQPLDTIADQFGIAVKELESKKQIWEQKLFNYRQQRSKPRLDDKSLTSWNALMLKGFVDAYKALGTEKYLIIALDNARFLLKMQWAEDGNLWHSHKNGQSTINGFLEDYALVIDAFIALYEVTFDETWLQHSRKLADYCFDHFYDDGNSFFAFTSNLDEALIARHFETEDNVIPASNSAMADNLFRLSIYYNNPIYEKVATDMLEHIIPLIDYPSAFSNWLNVFLKFEHSKQLAICGTEAHAFNRELCRQYFPGLLVCGTEISSPLPFLEHRFVEGKDVFYLCQNKVCQFPKEDFTAVMADLNS